MTRKVGVEHPEYIDLIAVDKEKGVTDLTIYQAGDLGGRDPKEFVKALRMKINHYIRCWKDGSVEKKFPNCANTYLEISFATTDPIPSWLQEEILLIRIHLAKTEVKFNHLQLSV